MRRTGLARHFSIQLLTAALFVFALVGTAAANGRFPRAQHLLEAPNDPNHLYLAATFGLLVTANRGQSWYHICESSFAQQPLEGDPQLEVTANGSLLAGIFETLNLSTDCGCAWRTVLGAPSNESVLDVSRHASGSMVALVKDIAQFPPQLRIDESIDSGVTWHLLSRLPSDVVDGYTLDVAPSDTSRIYVSVAAKGTDAAALLVSEDRGAHWERRAIPSTDSRVLPYIAAIDPANSSRLYVRTDDWESTGDSAAQDALLVSEDAGRSWNEALRRNAKLLGFALSPDGGTVLAGYGDPIEAGRSVNLDDFGMYRASASDLLFEKIYEKPIACLRWTAKGLYACVLQVPPDSNMALGFAPNADFSLASPNPLEALLDQRDVRGPLGCTATTCGETWQEGVMEGVPVCKQLNASCSFDASANVPACSAGIVTTGGAGSVGGAGGESGSNSAGNAGTGAAGGESAGVGGEAAGIGGAKAGAGGATAGMSGSVTVAGAAGRTGGTASQGGANGGQSGAPSAGGASASGAAGQKAQSGETDTGCSCHLITLHSPFGARGALAAVALAWLLARRRAKRPRARA